MWFLSVIFAISVIVVTLLVNWFISLQKYDGLKSVPGPKPFPIIGNAYLMKNSTVGLLHSFLKLGRQYGTFYKLWLGPHLHLMVSNPKYLEELLTSNVHLGKSDGYDLFKPWLGDGLLLSTGHKWRSRRKMITPTFHFKILDEFMNIFNKQFNTTIDILSKEIDKKPNESLEITYFVNLASLDIICETAFGTPIDAQHKGNAKYVAAVSILLEIITLRFFSGWLRNPILFRFSFLYKRYKKNLKILHDFTTNIIRHRKVEYRKIKENVTEGQSAEGIKRKAALLDMLLEATYDGHELSDKDIKDEVDTFMFEGHDTTSSAICYVLYAICQNEEIQNKIYQELSEVIGKESKTEITISQINDLKYLDIVVKEALRMYSPVPLIERRLDDNWLIDGITVPKGTSISIFLYGMNHNPDVFPEPEKFNPERFLPENLALRHTYAFIPFSAGPRNCIGQKYALYELKTCVAKILLQFKLILDPTFQPEIGMCSVLKSRNGIRMKLELRKTN